MQVVSLEGWTILQYETQDGYAPGAWIFYQLVILSIRFFALQLLLAVMFVAFAIVREKQDILQTLTLTLTLSLTLTLPLTLIITLPLTLTLALTLTVTPIGKVGPLAGPAGRAPQESPEPSN